MNKIVHYIGLDVHKDSIAVSIAPANSTEVRRYGIIGGTLDAVDKLVKKLAAENVELRLAYEAGPCGFVLCRHLRNKGFHGMGYTHFLLKGLGERSKAHRCSGLKVRANALRRKNRPERLQ